MKVLGYVNRLREFPAPLVTVALHEGKFFAIYPSGELVRIVDMVAIEDLQAQAPQDFIPASSCLSSNDPTKLISFGLDSNHIVTTDRARLRDAIKMWITSSVDGEAKEILENYEKELASSPRVNADALARTLRNRRDVRLSITSRVRKGHTGSDPNQDRRRPVMLVQRISRRKTTTLYSKGLPSHSPASGKWFGPPASIAGFLSKLALIDPPLN